MSLPSTLFPEKQHRNQSRAANQRQLAPCSYTLSMIALLKWPTCALCRNIQERGEGGGSLVRWINVRTEVRSKKGKKLGKSDGKRTRVSSKHGRLGEFSNFRNIYSATNSMSEASFSGRVLLRRGIPRSTHRTHQYSL